MRRIIVLVFLITFHLGYTQDTIPDGMVDPNYREDHFYIGITYNVLLNRPSGITQNNLPYGIQLGYIRDIPINKRRNVAIALGLGYGLNAYFTNLRAIESNGGVTYERIPEEVSFSRNKIETHLIELPIEFRWRTSRPDTYKFWRVYGGVKLGYVFANSSKFVGDGEKDRFRNEDLEMFQADAYFSFGFNTWNFYASYALNGIFQKEIQTTSGETIDMRALKVGLIFYLF